MDGTNFRWHSRRLGLGAARPIEPVIETDNKRVEVGLHAHGRDRVEIVVPATEIVEVIFDFRREIFNQTELDTDADDSSLTKLAELTERYCVVGQSLAKPPQFVVRRVG